MAYTFGKAAKMAPPPSRSQTSLPSQTGAMALMTVRRSVSSFATQVCSMPTPRSKPSRMA